MQIDRQDVRALEFDFLVVDRDGHVGMFASNGYGEIPSTALRSESQDQLPDIEAMLISQLPIIGAARPDGKGPGDCQEWTALGARGVFVFDWNRVQECYERVIVPSKAVNRHELRAEAQNAVAEELQICFLEEQKPQAARKRV